VNEASPIIDFYPPTFDIDMNGKRMAWQGVALLPFIDETRLLEAIQPLYPQLSEEEHQRNSWGNNSIFVSESHPMYDSIAALYGKRKGSEVTSCLSLDVHKPTHESSKVQMIDSRKSLGLAGSVKADGQYFPSFSYTSPLQKVALGDIEDNRSITALYFYPKQTIPHRSRLLPNVKLPPRVLNPSDHEHVQRGGRGRGVFDRWGDDRRLSSYRGQESRGYAHQPYGNIDGRRTGDNGRGEPSYSYTPGSYRGLPPRGVARAGGYVHGSR